MPRSPNSLVTLIGDIVGSRHVVDQKKVLRDVRQTLDWVNLQVPAQFSLQATVGDEFQGAYRKLSEALLATLLVSLRLKGTLDVRFGVGQGEVTVTDRALAPAGQSGPGWWMARQAIEEISAPQSGTKGWPSTLRSRFAGEEPQEGLVNAFLLCRDQVLATMDAKDARIAIGLFLREPQQKVADELGISQSAVSHRQRRRGPSSLVRAHESLAGWDAT